MWRHLLAARRLGGQSKLFDTNGCQGILAGMPRKLRVQYPDAIYHLTNRGDRRKHIFEDDDDRRRFLETLGQTCQRNGWQVHASCLMSHHFQL